MAVAPFAAHFFPDAKIVPVLASIYSTEADWAAMADLLKPLLTERTLIVQSTDYSHYRPAGKRCSATRKRSRRSPPAIPRASVLAAAIAHGLEGGAVHPAGVAAPPGREARDPRQPQFSRLRDEPEGDDELHRVGLPARTRRRARCSPMTTSRRRSSPAMCCLGATSCRRCAIRMPWALIRDTVLGITRAAPLVINLEGVLLDRAVSGVEHTAHVMVTEDAAPVLAALNARAASLANNHANDLGAEGRSETVRQLERLGSDAASSTAPLSTSEHCACSGSTSSAARWWARPSPIRTISTGCASSTPLHRWSPSSIGAPSM